VATGADAKSFSSSSRCLAFDDIGLLEYRLLVDSGYYGGQGGEGSEHTSSYGLKASRLEPLVGKAAADGI